MTTLVSYAQNFEDVMLWRESNLVKNVRIIGVRAQTTVFELISTSLNERGFRDDHEGSANLFLDLFRRSCLNEIMLEIANKSTRSYMKFCAALNNALPTWRKMIGQRYTQMVSR